MPTEVQIIFNIVAGIAGFLGAFLMRSLWDAIKELQAAHTELVKRHSETELLVAGNYAKREDVERLVQALFAKLDKIENKLDHKVDKI